MTILAATDLAETTDPAVTEAAMRAHATGAELVVCTVLSSLLQPNVIEEVALDTMRQSLRGEVPEPVRWRCRIAYGSPHVGILALEKELKPALVVMRRERTPSAAGAVGMVARYSVSSVLVVGRGDRSGPILVATDLVPALFPAIHSGIRLSKRGRALHVVHCQTRPSPVSKRFPSRMFSPTDVISSPPADMDPEEARQIMMQAVRSEGGSATFHVVEGRPREAIQHIAKEIGASLIVLGARGRSNCPRLGIGSEVEALLHESSCSVFIAR